MLNALLLESKLFTIYHIQLSLQIFFQNKVHTYVPNNTLQYNKSLPVKRRKYSVE